MGCTALLHDRRALGQCYQGEWNNLPSYYQYFNEPTLAGGLASVDYCPYVRPFSNRVCVHPRDQPSPNYQGMIMSDDSYCFESTLRQAIDGKTVTSPKVACYKVECVSPSLLRINISKHNGGTQVVECTGTETKSVSGFTGSFTCIDPGIYCQQAFRTTDVKSSGLGWISPTISSVASASQTTGGSLRARMLEGCVVHRNLWKTVVQQRCPSSDLVARLARPTQRLPCVMALPSPVWTTRTGLWLCLGAMAKKVCGSLQSISLPTLGMADRFTWIWSRA